MADVGFPGQHTTTTTVTSSTTVQTNIRFDPLYVRTLPGILKVVQVVSASLLLHHCYPHCTYILTQNLNKKNRLLHLLTMISYTEFMPLFMRGCIASDIIYYLYTGGYISWCVYITSYCHRTCICMFRWSLPST